MEIRKGFLIPVGGSVFVLALAFLLAASQLSIPAVDAQDPADSGAMSLSIENFAGSCDGDRCVLELGSEFDLVVSIDGVPYNPEAPEDGFLLGSCSNGRDDGGGDGADAADASLDCTGYVVVQSFVDYGSYDASASENGAGPNTCSDGLDNDPERDDGPADRFDEDCVTTPLVYLGDATEAEIEAAKNCGSLALAEQRGASRGAELGLVEHSCISGTSLTSPEPDDYLGPFVTLAFSCSDTASLTEVALRPLNDPVARGSGAGFVHADEITQVPASDAVTVICGNPADLPPVVTQSAANSVTPEEGTPQAIQTATGVPGAGEPPEQDDSSGTNSGVVIGVVAAVVVGVLALGGGAYVWRRRLRPR